MVDHVLDEEAILATFDSLVARGVIYFSSDETSTIVDDNFHFEFRVCSAYLTKPNTPTVPLEENGTTTFGPGSDIVNSNPELTIKLLHDTHRLVLNKYCVFRPQFLILTMNSYLRQTELLDISDFRSTWTALQSLRGEYFAIYNCGPEAGCSRLHKHLQMLPVSPNFKFFPDREDLDLNTVPYKFLLSRLTVIQETQADQVPTKLHDEYQKLITQAKALLGNGHRTYDYFPHNIVLTKRWLLVIPRCKETSHGLSANAAGMCGMVWVATREQVKKWREAGPAKVLSELGAKR